MKLLTCCQGLTVLSHICYGVIMRADVDSWREADQVLMQEKGGRREVDSAAVPPPPTAAARVDPR